MSTTGIRCPRGHLHMCHALLASCSWRMLMMTRCCLSAGGTVLVAHDDKCCGSTFPAPGLDSDTTRPAGRTPPATPELRHYAWRLRCSGGHCFLLLLAGVLDSKLGGKNDPRRVGSKKNMVLGVLYGNV